MNGVFLYFFILSRYTLLLVGFILEGYVMKNIESMTDSELLEYEKELDKEISRLNNLQMAFKIL